MSGRMRVARPVRARSSTPVDRTTCPRWQAGDTKPWHHGTEAANKSGCKCPDAVADRQLRQKLRRAGIAKPHLVSSVGTVRRLRALAVMGWTREVIADAVGLAPNHLWQVRRGDYAMVTAETAETVTAVYRRLAFTDGGSGAARRAAVRNGWVGPFAWHNLDNPDEVPNAADTEERFVDVQEKLVAALHRDFPNDAEKKNEPTKDSGEPDLMAPFALVNAPKLWRSMSVVDRDYALTELRKYLTVPEIAARVGVPEGHVADAWSGAMRRARKTQKQQTDAA